MIVPEGRAFQPERSAPKERWESLLRGACETLCRAPGIGVTAISVMGTAPCGPDEAVMLLDLTMRLADEYGLAGRVQLDRALPSVRFSQRPLRP